MSIVAPLRRDVLCASRQARPQAFRVDGLIGNRLDARTCGVIDYNKAFVLIRSTSGFPRPLADEETRRSLRAKVGPLLENSAANFLRALKIDPNNSDAMTYLGFVKDDEAYITESVDDSTILKAEAADWYGKVDQIKAARAKAAGQPWPPGDTAVIAFKRIPGKPPIPSFPPDAAS